LDIKNFSVLGKPRCLSSRKSQCKNKNKRNTPPATSRIGADFSMDSKTKGSLDQAAEKICIGFRDALKAQIIAKGRRPRTKNTAINMPQVKNHRLAFAPIVESTSALMMALSTDETASKSDKPMIVNKAENSIVIFYPTWLQLPIFVLRIEKARAGTLIF